MTPPLPDPAASDAAARDFYKTVQIYEHHFNNLEFEVRKFASAWLLAAFAAVGFILRGGTADGGLFSTWEMLLLVAGLAQLGLFSLWILDQVVYHGLLDAVFTAALEVEQRLPDLVPLRSMMMKMSGGTGMARYISLFYLLPMLAFVGLAAIAVVSGGLGNPGRLALLAIAVLPAWVTLKTWTMKVRRGNTRPPYAVALDRWHAGD